MGAWIEIVKRCNKQRYRKVAPFMGAWIEITAFRIEFPRTVVAPFMGAWIEIAPTSAIIPGIARRSLHGSVD